MLEPDLSVLPPAQARFWADHARAIPQGFVLYGGTAIALRLGHRQSVDFDWFTSAPDLLTEVEVFLDRFPKHDVLQQDNETCVVSVRIGRQPLKLAFYALKIGRVGLPDRCENGVFIASPLDLLATKLKVILDRSEAKDYLDIDALLRSGLSLDEGLPAAWALYPSLPPMVVAKAVGWFSDGNLKRELPVAVRKRLAMASAEWRVSDRRMRLLSKKLAPAISRRA